MSNILGIHGSLLTAVVTAVKTAAKIQRLSWWTVMTGSCVRAWFGCFKQAGSQLHIITHTQVRFCISAVCDTLCLLLYFRPVVSIIVLSSFFFSFFLALSQRSQIGCLPYFSTWCGPSAHHCAILSGYIFATKAHIDNLKKSAKQRYLPHISSQWWTSAH